MTLSEVPLADGGVKFGNSLMQVSRDAVAEAAAAGDSTVTIGVRPEHLDLISEGDALAAGGNGLAVTVNVVEELGADGYVYGTAKVGDEDKDLVVRVSGRAVPQKGEVLHVVPRVGETHVFSTSTGARLSD
jgi:multiple sugar transport system ATP-binding protein